MACSTSFSPCNCGTASCRRRSRTGGRANRPLPSSAATVEEEPHGGAQPPLLLGGRLAADQQRDALRQTDDDDEEVLGAGAGIAELDRAAIRISAQDLHDLVETVTAAALEK